MTDRVFRLSIAPERAPDVRRVVDFDGGDTLHDVHCAIQSFLELDNDHLYAFYLSGNYFDRATEYGIADDSAHDSSKARLFRLGLSEGQELAYLFDFGDELRHVVKVVSVSEVPQPLGEPTLVESVGEAPPQYAAPEALPLPEYLVEVAPLAEAVLSLSERLDVLYEEDDAKAANDHEAAADGPPPEIVAALGQLAQAALALAAALEEDEDALFDLDDWSGERELLRALVGLPHELVNVGDLEGALSVARAFHFAHPEAYDGDVAVILAEAGKHDEALAQIAANLERSGETFLTISKCGEALEVLGDLTRAESFYRKAITLAGDDEERESAVSQLFGYLEDEGRGDEAEALLASMEAPGGGATPSASAGPKVGRNDACPCGSGKKYKKCHGAPS